MAAAPAHPAQTYRNACEPWPRSPAPRRLKSGTPGPFDAASVRPAEPPAATATRSPAHPAGPSVGSGLAAASPGGASAPLRGWSTVDQPPGVRPDLVSWLVPRGVMPGRHLVPVEANEATAHGCPGGRSGLVVHRGPCDGTAACRNTPRTVPGKSPVSRQGSSPGPEVDPRTQAGGLDFSGISTPWSTVDQPPRRPRFGPGLASKIRRIGGGPPRWSTVDRRLTGDPRSGQIADESATMGRTPKAAPDDTF